MPLPQYLPYARFLLDADLSHTAKLLYTLLLDRATLDLQGRIYVIYPLSHLAKDLGCCFSSVTRSFAELENANLVERVRYGFSKPSHILLKVPHIVQNCAGIVCTSAQADCAETHSMVAQKCTPNQRNKNNLKDNHLIRANSAHLSLGECKTGHLQTTMGAAHRFTMHTAMWSSGRPCAQRTLDCFSGAVSARVREFPCRVHCERSDGSGSACAHDELRTHPERTEQQLLRAE